MIFSFGEYRLDVGKHQLSKNGAEQKIEPQVFKILVFLLENRDQLVTKDQLYEHVWKGRVVSEAAVNSRIRSARKAIGDDGTRQKLIQTVHGKGFRFVGEVTAASAASDATANAAPQSDETVTEATQTPASAWPKWLAAAALILLVSVFVFQRSVVNEPAIQTSAAQIQSLAVLPFADMSPNQDLQYLADGFSEELLNLLAQVDGLKVTSRSSTFALRDSTQSAREIGETLQVTHLLEGSVRRSENTARITVQLIDTGTDTHLWSKTFDRVFDPKTLLTMQDDIAASVVSAISNDLSIQRRESDEVTNSTPAYEAFLRGNELRQKETRASLLVAVEQFELALSLDANFAQAYAGLAATNSALLIHDFFDSLTVENSYELTVANLEKALELAPKDPYILSIASRMAFESARYNQVYELADLLLEIEPNSAAAYEFRGRSLLMQRRLESAHTALLKARTLDPLSPTVLTALGDTKYLLGDLEGALNVANDNFKWNFDQSSAYELLIYLNRVKADYAEAHRLIKESLEIYPNSFIRRDELIALLSSLGAYEEAIASATTPHLAAWGHAINGKLEAAFESAKKSPRWETDVELLLMLEQYEKARVYYDERSDTRGLSQRTSMPVGSERHYFETCFVHTKLGIEKTSPICQQLNTFYQNATLTDLKLRSQILFGAAWHLLNGRPEQALEWCWVLVNQGHIFLNNFETPLLRELKSHAGFAELAATMKENAQYHLRLIANQ